MLWEDNYLAHYGIKGQRWGLRRFQNEDGTLTLEGKKRYLGESLEKLDKLIKKQEKRVQKSPGDTSKQRTLNDMRLISDYKNTKKELRKLTKGDDWDAYKPGDPQNKINYPGVTDKMVEKADQLRQKRDALYEKVSKIGTKVDDLPSPGTENKDYLGITGAKKPGFFSRIKANAEAMVYPPELQGKSKEEKKAWEAEENAKFDAYTKLTSKMHKYDKLSEEEQDEVRKSVDNRMVELNKKVVDRTITDAEREERNELGSWQWNRSFKDAEKKLDKISKSGSDDEKEDFIKKAYAEGQVSPNFEAMVKLMTDKSGDALIGESKTTANRNAQAEWDKTKNEYEKIYDGYVEQAKKEHPMHYQRQVERRIELCNNSSELKEAKLKINTAFEKYCAVVLKDMGWPVNDKTMEYITSIIYWE